MTPQAPLRPCPRCGRTHRAWTHDRICTRCSSELRRLEQGQPSLRELREQNQARLRARAEARRQQTVDQLEGRTR